MNDTSMASWSMKTPGLATQAEAMISEIVRQRSGAGLHAWASELDDRLNNSATLCNAFQQSVWVYACVTTLAENVSGIPFRILTGAEDDERIVSERVSRSVSENHRGVRGEEAHSGAYSFKRAVLEAGAPRAERADSEIGAPGAAALFDRPHPQLDRFQFWELLVSWLMLRGEVFVAATNDDDEVVPLDGIARQGACITRLHVLCPDRFREVVCENQLEGWQYRCGAQDGSLGNYEFLPGEVLHIKLPNPFNFWRGLSPLTIGLLAAQTDYASAQFMKGLMLNNADTGLIVTAKEGLQEPQRQQILAALRERKRNAGTADRPLVLEYDVKVEKPAISTADLQMLENRKFNRQEICAIYKVPQELLGFSEDANRAIADAVRMSFMENRIVPLCRRIEAGIDPVIKAFERSQRGEFHVKGTPIMQAAQRTRVDSAMKVWGMAVPFNEVNRAYDLGFPKLPWGDKAYLPTSVQEVGVMAARAGKREGENAFERMAEMLNGGVSESVDRPVSERSGTDTVAECEAAVMQGTKGKIGKLRKFFFEQRGRVLAKLEQLTGDAGDATPGRRGEDTAPYHRGVDGIFDSTVEDVALVAKLKALWVADLAQGAQMVAKDFKMREELVAVFAVQRENEIKKVNAETRQKLEEALRESAKADEDFEQRAQRVKEIFQHASDERAEAIAERETRAAMNAGRFAAMSA